MQAVPEVQGDSEKIDPDTGLRDLATQLAEAYRMDPQNALLARELRMTLQSLKPQAVGPSKLQEFLSDLQA